MQVHSNFLNHPWHRAVYSNHFCGVKTVCVKVLMSKLNHRNGLSCWLGGFFTVCTNVCISALKIDRRCFMRTNVCELEKLIRWKYRLIELNSRAFACACKNLYHLRRQQHYFLFRYQSKPLILQACSYIQALYYCKVRKTFRSNWESTWAAFIHILGSSVPCELPFGRLFQSTEIVSKRAIGCFRILNRSQKLLAGSITKYCHHEI